ncbi:LysM domain-containing protein [Synechococcus sp. A15-127]|uniref:LysM peptidoglycan-binding domain-containing protein n=1 Tax=Synechococcus sp. A15-127 TaxID=1050624 RepID=UPI0016450B53|nr:LysM peptidoglycan-binding domain-containing protein [Synechococcus sp. A15-127]QNI93654.1 LysM domain-containing protein [Synechococcus sp. A15-127]
MRLPSFAALVLTALLPLSAAAATVTVRSGETLSDIAARYDVSVASLMRLNRIKDPDHVEIGSRLKVPGHAASATAGPGRHRVSEGETLGEIAVRYQISSRDLIALNGLRNADHVELGETLKLPANAVLPVAKPKKEPINVVPGASQHTVGQGQTLSQIARAYNLPMTSLVNFNQLDNPDQVTVGMRLYLKAPVATVQTAKPQTAVKPSTAVKPTTTFAVNTATAPVKTATKPVAQKPATKRPAAKASKPVDAVIAKQAEWRTYGPLQVDWANWRPMGGSQVVPSLNDKGQALYLAVNCSAGKINATGADGSWKAWAAPSSSFEKDLVKDRCQARA